jgi:hypothetical protein
MYMRSARTSPAERAENIVNVCAMDSDQAAKVEGIQILSV